MPQNSMPPQGQSDESPRPHSPFPAAHSDTSVRHVLPPSSQLSDLSAQSSSSQIVPNAQVGQSAPGARQHVQDTDPSQIQPQTQQGAHNRRLTNAEPITRRGSVSSIFPRLFPSHPSVSELPSPSTSSIRLFRQHQPQPRSTTSPSFPRSARSDPDDNNNNSNADTVPAAPGSSSAGASHPTEFSPAHTASIPSSSSEMVHHSPRFSRLHWPAAHITANGQSAREGYTVINEESANRSSIPDDPSSSRRRSSSEPQRPTWALVRPDAGPNAISSTNPNSTGHVATIHDVNNEPYVSSPPPSVAVDFSQMPPPPPQHTRGRRFTTFESGVTPSAPARLKTASTLQDAHDLREGQPSSWLNFWSAPRPRAATSAPSIESSEYGSDVVRLLDTVDPEVATLTTLNNVQNSLFVPYLGRHFSRLPAYTLDSPQEGARRGSQSSVNAAASHVASSAGASSRPQLQQVGASNRIHEYKGSDAGDDADSSEAHRLRPTVSADDKVEQALSDENVYFILPDGVNVDGWTEEDKAQLNDFVRHMLHSRRSKFRRSMKGFGKYVSKPLGFFVTLYATLITLFGLAWVLFLIGWIYVGARQLYIINVIDNVLVALFAVMGDGLAPFRAIDTYHMIYIIHYARLTYRKRKEKNLPKLQNKNDLPQDTYDHDGSSIAMSSGEPMPVAQEMGRTAIDANSRIANEAADDGHDERRYYTGDDEDVEKGDNTEFSVLTPAQQACLTKHQTKFAHSHTFYKPHETITHHAFPLNLFIAIVVLLDCHSIFQIALGACTWGINYHVRPFALTTVILCFSIVCNITAGLLIWVGDVKTRKKDVVKRMFRQELTGEAIDLMQKQKRKEEEKRSMDIKRSLDITRSQIGHNPHHHHHHPHSHGGMLNIDMSAIGRRSLDLIRKPTAMVGHAIGPVAEEPTDAVTQTQNREDQRGEKKLDNFRHQDTTQQQQHQSATRKSEELLSTTTSTNPIPDKEVRG